MNDKSLHNDLPPEANDFTPEEIAEAEQLYQDSIRKHLKAFEQDNGGTLKRIYRISAYRKIKAKKEHQAEQEKKLSELIKLPLIPYPEATRVVSNDMARSALFSAIQGANREILKDKVLATIDGIEIIFTGEQLNQDDHDLLMQLVHMARHKPFGEYITVPANTILSGLGLDKGKSQHDQIKTGMKRLLATLVEIRNKRTRVNYYGHIIDKAMQDETRKYWVYRLNSDLRPLYDTTSFSLLEWEQRRALKRKDLARWLQSFYSTHANPFSLSVDFLHSMSGSKATLKEFRRGLRIALDTLVSIEFLQTWELDQKNDLVTVKRATVQKALSAC
jgi:hypothetical protein